MKLIRYPREVIVFAEVPPEESDQFFQVTGRSPRLPGGDWVSLNEADALASLIGGIEIVHLEKSSREGTPA